MTRKEAIDKVYGMSGTKEQHEALEFLIPELRELREFYERQQEDKRIRKELVEAFEALDIDSSWNGIPVKSILAWLKDQKPAEWNQDEFTENVRRLITDKLTVTTKGSDGSTLSSTVFIDDKTAKDIANGILFYVGREAQKNPDRDVPEWSEEDEKILQSIIKDFRAGKVSTIGQEQWLKSLPLNLKKKNEDVAKLCSKEWSQEDEDRIRQIERIAQLAGCTQKLQEEIHDWLKSLRPSWKPSKEQMEALLNTLHPDDPYYPDLKSLYEQLKKL